MGDNTEISFIADFVGGSIGGSAGIAVGHPIDLVKTRIQTGGGGQVLTGPVDGVVKTIRAEGFRGLYKGLLSPVLANAPINAVVFGSYGIASRFLMDYRQKHSNPTDPQPLSHAFLAGIFAGVTQTFILSPSELVKIRMQNQQENLSRKELSKLRSGNRTVYTGSIDCAIQIVKQGGVGSLFHGFGASLMRESFSYGIYFAVYEGLVRKMSPTHEADDPLEQTHSLKPVQILLAGASAGAIAWASIYPFDVVKSRIQASTEPSPGVFKLMSQIYEKEGTKPFTKGFGTCMARAIPVNAVTFLLYEATLDMWRSYGLP